MSPHDQWIDPYTATAHTLQANEYWSPQMRHALIAQAAYFRAERRGFAPGHELEDWLAAEAEVLRVLSGSGS
jgi:hypothetical protein